MKTIASIVSLFLLAALNCQADLTEKLIGTWAGTGTATAGEVTLSSFTVTTFKRFEKKGLTSKGTVKISGHGTSKGFARYYDSGKFEGTLTGGDGSVSLLTGTWSIADNMIVTKIKAEGLFPTFNQTTKTILLSPRKMNSVAKASNGVKAVGKFTKQ